MKQAIKDIEDKLKDGEQSFSAEEVVTLLNEIRVLRAVQVANRNRFTSRTIQNELLKKHLKGVK